MSAWVSTCPKSHSRAGIQTHTRSSGLSPLRVLLPQPKTPGQATHGKSGASWCPVDKGGGIRLGASSQPPSPTQHTSPEPHPRARREDEAARRGPELCGSCLGAAGWGPGCGGLDVHVELAWLLIVKVRVAGREAGGLSGACASVKGPSRSQCWASS